MTEIRAVNPAIVTANNGATPVASQGPTAIASHAPGFMPQLDALRAFAVLAVLVHHLREEYLLPGGVALGMMGVQLFFVLSGFLITGLLLQGRDAADRDVARPLHVLRQFYTRRALRIFPLYYFVLGTALVVRDPGIADSWPWLVTFTYNFWVASVGGWPDHFAHFWSLCVEEQFYLLWPCVILFAPRHRLAWIAASLVVVAFAYRGIAIFGEFNKVAFYTITLSSLDALGLGSLLAILSHDRALRRWRDRVVSGALVIALTGFALLMVSSIAMPIFVPTLTAMVFMWLVAGAARGYSGAIGRMLETRPLLYIGRISYGIYVYHLFIPDVFGPLLKRAGIELVHKGWPEFAAYSLITIMVAGLSWRFFENPINRLKRNFPLNA